MKASPHDIEAALRTGRLGTAEIEDKTPGPVVAPFAEDVSEKDFQAAVLSLARRNGFMCYHTRDSRRSDRGFPDLVLVRDRLLFAELKTNTGELTREQRERFDAINAAGVTACIWRPRDWPMIVKELE